MAQANVNPSNSDRSNLSPTDPTADRTPESRDSNAPNDMHEQHNPHSRSNDPNSPNPSAQDDLSGQSHDPNLPSNPSERHDPRSRSHDPLPQGHSSEQSRRCGAAHPDDPSPCEGEQRAVRITLGTDEVLACVNHGARLVASVDDARVFPVDSPGNPHADAALEVARRAAGMNPFFWMAPATPSTASTKATHHRPHAHGRRRPDRLSQGQ